MENTSSNDILSEFKKLLALNRSLESRLGDYETIIKSRDQEIGMLQSLLTEASAHRSDLDGQVNELRDLKHNFSQLQQQVGTTPGMQGRYLQGGTTAGVEEQFANLKLQYTYLQAQLTDLQKQLVEQNNRNLLLQQQMMRTAELESLVSKEWEGDDSEREKQAEDA